MKRKQPGMWGAPSAAKRARYSTGDSPTMALNVEENDPRLDHPTSMQISVTRPVRSRPHPA
jgi:hypothetical protein